MKKFIIGLSLLFGMSSLFGQTPTPSSPKLNLVGSHVGLSKGDIQTETLLQIIQKLQLEIRDKVFTDIVVKNFKKLSPSSRNFTTYYYLYNLMQTITEEKNKTIITRDLMQSSLEFALAYGFLAYAEKTGIEQHANEDMFYSELVKVIIGNQDQVAVFEGKGKDAQKYVSNWKIEDIKVKATSDGGPTEKPSLLEGEIFNFLIDLVFDAAINNQNLQNRNLFKGDFKDSELSVWYDADNQYRKIILKGQDKELADGTIIKASEKNKKRAEAAKKVYNEINSVINHYLTLTTDVNTLFKFIKDLKADDIGLVNMTEDQYLAMRSILREVIGIIRLNYDKSVVYKITNFLLDYTLIEYTRDDDNKIDKTKTANLFVDIESLISALDQHYNSKSRKSSTASKYWYINPRLFLSIGTNYGSFLNTNGLKTNNSGESSNLESIYFASEKIGLKIKFFDLEYTRAFSPGEKFKYKGVNRVWLRPQKKTLISNMHLIIYGSGILYNLADLKSENDFNEAVLGTGLGVTFFNGLSANAGIAVPFTGGNFKSDNAYLNLGIDIPILEYLGALKKNK